MVRILFHDSIRDDPEAIARAREISLGGSQARTTLAGVPAMVISDRETAVIFPDPADPTAGTTWTREAAIISALAALFDQAWHAAMPLAADRSRMSSGRGLADAERDLLRLLAAGATDEVAARRLGMSLRTTRRYMATLMSQLDAVSRFQAGAEAARRG